MKTIKFLEKRGGLGGEGGERAAKSFEGLASWDLKEEIERGVGEGSGETVYDFREKKLPKAVGVEIHA